jgi:hypothetical protein
LDASQPTEDRGFEDGFSLMVPIEQGTRQAFRLPYSAVTDSWVGEDGTINLILSVKLVIRDGRLTANPYR